MQCCAGDVSVESYISILLEEGVEGQREEQRMGKVSFPHCLNTILQKLSASL